MIKITDQSGFDEACKSIGLEVTKFMRTAQKNKQGPLSPLLDTGCVPFPEKVGGDVTFALRRFNFGGVNLRLIRMAMNEKTSRTDWEVLFCELFRVLAKMESK